MEMLSEDPTYVVGALGILAAVFLVALRVTQQGKFLVWALVAGALALLAIVIDLVWVTDNERIAAVVYDLGRAVKNSDADRVIAHLTPDVRYAPSSDARFPRGGLFSGENARRFVRANLAEAHFDVVRVSHLQVHAGEQTRRGTADFRVLVSGQYRGRHGTSVSDWSLGFRETRPTVWQVERITPTRIPSPEELVAPPTESAPRRPRGLPITVPRGGP
jgi:hypothetical protein